jgi:hypothetical protein
MEKLISVIQTWFIWILITGMCFVTVMAVVIPGTMILNGFGMVTSPDMAHMIVGVSFTISALVGAIITYKVAKEGW